MRYNDRAYNCLSVANAGIFWFVHNAGVPMTEATNHSSPKRTPLFQWHVDRGGRMVDFAGWEMPVQYSSIVDEHHATRNKVSVFDVSHMGRLRFEGPGAGTFLDQLLTRSVLDMQLGQVRYSLICNHDGGILDAVSYTHLTLPTKRIV